MICGGMVKSVLINGNETWSLDEDDRQEENPRNWDGCIQTTSKDI
jgi:hypothetical protein